MRQIIDIYRKTRDLHHAYLIEGDISASIARVSDFLENELNFSTKGNPDFWQGIFGSFGIDDARDIKEIQSRKSFGGGKKIFILACNSATTEAQNSLLKMFEEPTQNTHFFVLARSSDIFLPTLKSRMMIVKGGSELGESTEEYEQIVEKFLKIDKPARLKLLKDMISEKDKDGAARFLDSLEKTLRNKINMNSADRETRFVFEEIIKARKYLNYRSPSVRIILESIALITPIYN